MPPALLLELAENSESGQNPERYRHCMRGGTARDESPPLGLFPEKAVRKAHDTRVRRLALMKFSFSVVVLNKDEKPKQ